MNSRQGARYIKTRMGNEIKNKILLQNGIITQDQARPQPSVLDVTIRTVLNVLILWYPLHLKKLKLRRTKS
jgi:integrase/recombinase XerD